MIAEAMKQDIIKELNNEDVLSITVIVTRQRADDKGETIVIQDTTPPEFLAHLHAMSHVCTRILGITLRKVATMFEEDPIETQVIRRKGMDNG